MVIKLKDSRLVFTVKIARDLHDELDKMRALAKTQGAEYDPSEAVEKALRKDIAASKKALASLKESGGPRSKE